MSYTFIRWKTWLTNHQNTEESHQKANKTSSKQLVLLNRLRTLYIFLNHKLLSCKCCPVPLKASTLTDNMNDYKRRIEPALFNIIILFFCVKTTLLVHFVSKSSLDAFSLQLLLDSAQVVRVRIPETVETEYVQVLIQDIRTFQ